MDNNLTHQDALVQELYLELKHIARQQLRRELPGFTLSPTDLVHESWLRLSAQTQTKVTDQNHFKALVATTMRRVLVDHVRAKLARKRDAGQRTYDTFDFENTPIVSDHGVLQIHEALLELALFDSRCAQVVEMKFFAGMEIKSIAQALGISEPTVKRDWLVAKAWLSQKISD